jgi:hypothetical protein
MLLLIANQQGASPSVGNPKAFEDVTTALIAHLAALRAANSGKDLSTLATKDFVTMRAAVSAGNRDDLNTAIAESIFTNG